MILSVGKETSAKKCISSNEVNWLWSATMAKRHSSFSKKVPSSERFPFWTFQVCRSTKKTFSFRRRNDLSLLLCFEVQNTEIDERQTSNPWAILTCIRWTKKISGRFWIITLNRCRKSSRKANLFFAKTICSTKLCRIQNDTSNRRNYFRSRIESRSCRTLTNNWPIGWRRFSSSTSRPSKVSSKNYRGSNICTRPANRVNAQPKWESFRQKT